MDDDMDFDSAAKPSRVICCNRIVENHLYTLICKKKDNTMYNRHNRMYLFLRSVNRVFTLGN